MASIQCDVPRTEVNPKLSLLLRILAVVLFFYWGLTHLIYPEWYLVKLMGVTQFDPVDTYDAWSANLMGVLNVAFAITIWRAASDPVKFRIIIDMILMVSIGTIIVFVISLVARDLSPREWINTGLMAGTVILLIVMYPKPVRS